MLLVAIVTGAWATDVPVTWTASESNLSTQGTAGTSLKVSPYYISVGTGNNSFRIYGCRAASNQSNTWNSDENGIATADNAIAKSGIAVYVPSTSNDIQSITVTALTTNSRKVYYTSGNALPTSNPSTYVTLTKSAANYTPWGNTLEKGKYYSIGGQNGGSGVVVITKIVVVFADDTPAKDYTVTAVSNNENWGTVEATATSLDEGETATITATPKSGYEFISWSKEGEGAELSSTTENPTTLTMGTADATVTATFSASTLNITHNEASNGTYTISVAGGEATSENTTATIGQTITLAGTPVVPSFTEVVWNVKDAHDNNVTVTNNQFTMPSSSVTISPVFSKPYFVKVAVTGANTADVTPTGIANYDINCQSNTKLGSKGHYVGFTLVSETLKAGDIVEVKISQAGGGKFIFYDSKEQTNTILSTDVPPTAGTHRFVLPATAEGENSLYLVRGQSENDGFNPYVTYIAIIRPDATVTLNAKGFATYSKATDFEFAGAKAYKMALNENEKTITGTEVTGKIAAGEGILLKGEAGAKIAITETTGATALEGNSLKGTTTASGKATVPTYCYTLSGDTFKKFKGAEFNDNKAYLESTQDLSGQSLEIIFDDQPTAINFVVEDDANVAVAPVKTIKNGQLFIGNYNVAGARIK